MPISHGLRRGRPSAALRAEELSPDLGYEAAKFELSMQPRIPRIKKDIQAEGGNADRRVATDALVAMSCLLSSDSCHSYY